MILIVVAVNWDDTRKVIELELSLGQLCTTIIWRSYDVQEKIILVKNHQNVYIFKFFPLFIPKYSQSTNPYQKQIRSKCSQ